MTLTQPFFVLGLIAIGVILYFLRIFRLTGADEHKLAGKGIVLPRNANIYEYAYAKFIV